MKDNERNKVFKLAGWQGKKDFGCWNGLLGKEILRAWFYTQVALGKNRVSGRPNRVSLYADMMRISDPASRRDQASSHNNNKLVRSIQMHRTWHVAHVCAEARYTCYPFLT